MPYRSLLAAPRLQTHAGLAWRAHRDRRQQQLGDERRPLADRRADPGQRPPPAHRDAGAALLRALGGPRLERDRRRRAAVRRRGCVGNNERMAWGFTFAGTDMVDVFVEELHPEERPTSCGGRTAGSRCGSSKKRFPVKGPERRSPIVLKFSRHGPDLLRGPGASPSRMPCGRSCRSRGPPPTRAASSSPRRRVATTSSTGRCTGWCRPTASICGDVGRQHRAPGDRAHARPRRVERAPAGARQR